MPDRPRSGNTVTLGVFDANLLYFSQVGIVFNKFANRLQTSIEVIGKCIIDNPLMCDGDGPINLVRKWYSQIMTDVADIREDQIKAREHVTVEGPSVEEVLAAG